MAGLTPINKPVRTTETKGRPSGQNKGGLLGAVLGGVAGAVAAPFTAGTSIPAGIAAGTALGATVGGLAGGAIQPAKAPEVTQEMLDSVPTQRMSQGSQELLAGIQALESYPDLARKYSQPLTQAYMQSQAQLSRRSV